MSSLGAVSAFFFIERVLGGCVKPEGRADLIVEPKTRKRTLQQER